MMQIEKRTAQQRREYMQQYHARRREAAKKLSPPPKLRQIVTFVRDLPSPAVAAMRSEWWKRQQFLESSGMWPERRHDHSETLEQTLERVKSHD